MIQTRTPRPLYLDTSMWNRLLDHGVEPRSLVDRLAVMDAVLVVGEHAVHELAKTFLSQRTGANRRAVALCQYLGKYVDLGVPLIKPNWALLIEEALHIVGDAGPPELFLVDNHRTVLRARLGEMAREYIKPTLRGELESQRCKSVEHTESIKQVLARETALASTLRAIASDELPNWITTETIGSVGIEALQIVLRTQFPKNNPVELWDVSRRLLDRPRYRVSRAVTRTTLYSLWRCANYGTVPKDFNDDLLHLTNASYCEFFATADPQHARQRSQVFDTCQIILSVQPNSPTDDIFRPFERVKREEVTPDRS